MSEIHQYTNAVTTSFLNASIHLYIYYLIDFKW